jgi:hypothetical protein
VKLKPNVRLGVLLLGGIVSLLALTRLVKLDMRMLTDGEAKHALTAAIGTPGESVFWDTKLDAGAQSPLYYLTTHLIFQIFCDSDAGARFIPAAAGVLLLLLILFLWRDGSLGEKLIWMVLLGFSPVMLMSSRTAGGDILAATAFFAFFLLLLQGDSSDNSYSYILLALAAGIALTTGSPVFKALSGITISMLIAILLRRSPLDQGRFFRTLRGMDVSAWLIPVVTVLILSGFGSSLQGLRGFAVALEEWLQGWVQPSGYSSLELMLLLVTSEPLIVIFGMIGAVRLWRSPAGCGQPVTLWAIGAAGFLLIYRSRTPLDLIWIVLPLSYLAIDAIQALIESIGDLRANQELIGLVALLAIFVASGALSFVAYSTGNVLTINPENPNLVFLLFFALGIMGLSVLIFFGVGWSWSIVLQAVGLLMILIGASQAISTSWRLNYNNQDSPVAELWSLTAPADGLPFMVQTLEHTALAYSGRQDRLPIEVQGELPASLAWALRAFQQVEGEAAFGVEAAPVIIAPEINTATSFPADYIGQNLGIRERRTWDSALPPDLLQWWIRRDVPVEVDQWVLWVRVDVASFGEISLDG